MNKIVIFLVLNTFLFGACHEQIFDKQRNCLMQEANKLKQIEISLMRERNKILSSQARDIKEISKVIKRK